MKVVTSLYFHDGRVQRSLYFRDGRVQRLDLHDGHQGAHVTRGKEAAELVARGVELVASG